MCFTAREHAVRRRWPASYLSHIVDRRLWSRVYFFRCNREVPEFDNRWTPMFTRTASSWRRYSSWYMFSRPWLALLLIDARANPRRRCSFALVVWMPTTPRAATRCCPARYAGRNPGAAPPCRRCYYYCRLKAYIVLTFFDSFRNKSGKPQPIQTKVGTHAQVKGRQRSRNFGRDRLSVGEMGAKKCPGRVFFCRQYQTIFRQLRNSRFSPHSATTRESWVKRRIRTEIYEKFSFRGHPEYSPISL